MQARSIFAAAAVLMSVSACGSSGSAQGNPDGSMSGQCPPGQTFCPSCGGGGSCSAACPGIECAVDDSGTSGHDAGGSDSAVNADGGLACLSAMPPVGQSCTAPQGCPYASTCAFCAPSNVGVAPVDCATQGCSWDAKALSPNDPACPNTPPNNGDSCGNYRTCAYCTGQGLLTASCMSAADTFTWSVGYTQNTTGGDASTAGHSFSCGPVSCDSATEICSITNGHLPGEAATYACASSDGGVPSCGGEVAASGAGQCGCYESSSGEVTSTSCPP
ncbi:MAG TPA: hypothetical protein VK762_20675 [Polyangiaceae bacterium]|nr:hypothetical protein [Polyangiaceae bacterium]